jgi:hypothetical protein
MSDIRLAQTTTPSTPSTGKARLYVNNSGQLELVLDSGIVRTFIYDFSASTLAVLLAGLSLADGTAVTAADSIIIAFGKLQTQINNIASFLFLKTTANLTNNSNVTLTNITELTIPVVAGKRYMIRTYIQYSSPALTTGIGLAYTATGGAAGTLAMQATIISNAANPTYEPINVFNTPVVSPSVRTISIPQIAIIEGIFVCTVSGNIIPCFRSEVNLSTVTLLSGSNVEYKEYT